MVEHRCEETALGEHCVLERELASSRALIEGRQPPDRPRQQEEQRQAAVVAKLLDRVLAHSVR